MSAESIVSRAHPDSLDTLQMAVTHTRRELRYVQTLLECSPHCLFAAGRPHRFTHRRVAAVTLGKLQFSLGQADYHPARSRSIPLSMYVLLTSDKPPTLPPVTPLVHLSAGLIDSGPARGPLYPRPGCTTRCRARCRWPGRLACRGSSRGISQGDMVSLYPMGSPVDGPRDSLSIFAMRRLSTAIERWEAASELFYK